MKLPLQVCRCWMAALLVAAFNALAVPVVVEASHDTSIYTGNSSSDNTADGAGEFLWVSTTAEGLVRRALIRFDLSALPAGTVVRQARLSLYESRSRTDHVVAVHRLLQPWGEGQSNGGGQGAGAPATAGDATWVNRFHPGSPWQTPGAHFVPTPSAQVLAGAPNERIHWGSTTALVADVQGWVNTPASNHGWVFIGDEVNSQSAKRFESRQNTTAVNRPRLELEVDLPAAPAEGDVPLPGWALLAAGVGCAAVLHRQRRTQRVGAKRPQP